MEGNVCNPDGFNDGMMCEFDFEVELIDEQNSSKVKEPRVDIAEIPQATSKFPQFIKPTHKLKHIENNIFETVINDDEFDFVGENNSIGSFSTIGKSIKKHDLEIPGIRLKKTGLSNNFIKSTQRKNSINIHVSPQIMSSDDSSRKRLQPESMDSSFDFETEVIAKEDINKKIESNKDVTRKIKQEKDEERRKSSIISSGYQPSNNLPKKTIVQEPKSDDPLFESSDDPDRNGGKSMLKSNFPSSSSVQKSSFDLQQSVHKTIQSNRGPQIIRQTAKSSFNSVSSIGLLNQSRVLTSKITSNPSYASLNTGMSSIVRKVIPNVFESNLNGDRIANGSNQTKFPYPTFNKPNQSMHGQAQIIRQSSQQLPPNVNTSATGIKRTVSHDFDTIVKSGRHNPQFVKKPQLLKTNDPTYTNTTATGVKRSAPHDFDTIVKSARHSPQFVKNKPLLKINDSVYTSGLRKSFINTTTSHISAPSSYTPPGSYFIFPNQTGHRDWGTKNWPTCKCRNKAFLAVVNKGSDAGHKLFVCQFRKCGFQLFESRFNSSIDDSRKKINGDFQTQSNNGESRKTAKPNTKTANANFTNNDYPMLSAEQQKIFNMVVNERSSLFFTGSAGTGKSFLLVAIIRALRKDKKMTRDELFVTAPTAVSALKIYGQTLHSFAGVGLAKGTAAQIAARINSNLMLRKRWCSAKLLIIDEVSMLDPALFEKFEEVRQNDVPFGGIQIVLSGDFAQLPPVVKCSNEKRYCFEANCWNAVVPLAYELSTVYRQKDPLFIKILNEMRLGNLSKKSIRILSNLENTVLLDAPELYPLRVEVEAANKVKMDSIRGEVHLFHCTDSPSDSDALSKKMDDSFLVERMLRLKIGAKVMYTKNNSITNKILVNGSLGTVVSFNLTTDNPIVCFDNGEEVEIKQEIFSIEDQTNGGILCHRSQHPLVLAFAMSIHKSQGQTLSRLVVDMKKIFEDGQAYVALSRCSSLQGLKVLNFSAVKVKCNPKVIRFINSLKTA